MTRIDKVGFPRSYSAMGSVGEQAQDKVAFRFIPGPAYDANHGVWTKGDGVLTIAELDYQKSQYKIPIKERKTSSVSLRIPRNG